MPSDDNQARETQGRFYLYEVYASAAPLGERLQTQHVHNFIAAIPALSTAEPPGSLDNSMKSPLDESASRIRLMILAVRIHRERGGAPDGRDDDFEGAAEIGD